MEAVKSVGTNNYSPRQLKNSTNVVHFKGAEDSLNTNSVPIELDAFIKEQENARKKAKRKNTAMSALQIGSLLGMIAMAGVVVWSFFKGGAGMDQLRSKTEQEALKLKTIDLSKIKERPKDSYSKEVQDFIDRLEGLLKRTDIEDKAGKRTTQVQLAGPGGTGKTDVAGVIAKKVNELYPGSEYYIPDLSMLSSSSYKGQDVQMLTEYTNAIVKRIEELEKETAKTGKKKYVVFFLDEYDKIAMVDHGFNKHDSNSKIGALKTLINGVMGHDNVLLLSATNYPELIEGAVGSRVADKVLVDYLTPKQTITAIVEHYKNAQKGKISKDLLDTTNAELNKICDIISQPQHEMEYRKLFNNIIPNTLIKSPEDGKIELKHLVEALTSPGIARELKLTREEIAKLQNIVNK